MEFLQKGKKYYYNSKEPFLWKIAGVASDEFYGNDIDKTITHLFFRLLKEIEVAVDLKLTSKPVYIFAYKGTPAIGDGNYNKLRSLNKKEIDLIFTIKSGDINKWGNLSIYEEKNIREKIDNLIPLSADHKLREEWPNWSNIDPSINEINNNSRIPDIWWIGGSPGDNLNGFVIKDLVYCSASENKYIDFPFYRQYKTGKPLISSSHNISVLQSSKEAPQGSGNFRKETPIIATAKLIYPYIVNFKDPAN